MNIRPVAVNSLNTCSPRKINPSFAHRNIYKTPNDTPKEIHKQILYEEILNNSEFLADNPGILDSLSTEEMQVAIAALKESDSSAQILEKIFITAPKKREYHSYTAPKWLKNCDTLREVIDAMKSSEKPEMTGEFYRGYFKSGHLFTSVMSHRCYALVKEEMMKDKLNTHCQKCNSDNEALFNEALYGIPLS